MNCRYLLLLHSTCSSEMKIHLLWPMGAMGIFTENLKKKRQFVFCWQSPGQQSLHIARCVDSIRYSCSPVTALLKLSQRTQPGLFRYTSAVCLWWACRMKKESRAFGICRVSLKKMDPHNHVANPGTITPHYYQSNVTRPSPFHLPLETSSIHPREIGVCTAQAVER